MRHLAVTFAAVVLLTFASALPVASFGLTAVTLTCNDGTQINAEVDANTLEGLVQAVQAMALYPAGLSCTLATTPLLGPLGGVAGAGELRGGFVVGGGRFLYPCWGNPAEQFWVNFAVSAHTETAAAGETRGGTMNFTAPADQCVTGHLTSKPICLGIYAPGAQPPDGAWYAFLRSQVTQTSGDFAVFGDGVIATGWKDTGNPGHQTSPDRVAASQGGTCPPDHGPHPDTQGSVPILNGNVTIHLK